MFCPSVFLFSLSALTNRYFEHDWIPLFPGLEQLYGITYTPQLPCGIRLKIPSVGLEIAPLFPSFSWKHFLTKSLVHKSHFKISFWGNATEDMVFRTNTPGKESLHCQNSSLGGSEVSNLGWTLNTDLHTWFPLWDPYKVEAGCQVASILPVPLPLARPSYKLSSSWGDASLAGPQAFCFCVFISLNKIYNYLICLLSFVCHITPL